MQKIYTAGIIGAGMIAEKHIDAFEQTGKVKIKWVARRNAEKLKSFQEKYKIPFGTTDYQELLNDQDVELVVITTPPQQHCQMFIDALKAGKHVLIEKPLGIARDELERMVQERQKHPELKVSSCSCRHARLQPKFRKAKEIIDSGRLGEIYFIHHNAVARQSRAGIEYHPAAKWFLNREIAGGGPLLDWGVYDMSFHLGLLNDKPELEKICTAFAKSGLDKVDPGTDIYDVEEHFMTVLQFTGDLKYYWERAAHANVEEDNQTRIYGTKGGIKLSYCTWESPEIVFFDVDNQGKGKARKEIINVNTETHGGDDFELAQHFIALIENKVKPMMPVEREQKHLNIIMDIYSFLGEM